MTAESKALALSLRRDGKSLSEIAEATGRAVSTVAGWLRGVYPTGHTKASWATHCARQDLERLVVARAVASQALSEKYRRQREEWFETGRTASLSQKDCFFLGLYLGEGSKSHGASQPDWVITNLDVQVIKAAAEWAVRWGQPRDKLQLVLYVTADDVIDLPSAQAHWAQGGIPATNISVYVQKPRHFKSGKPRKHNFGVARLRALGGGGRLYQMYRGQLAQLLGSDETTT